MWPRSNDVVPKLLYGLLESQKKFPHIALKLDAALRGWWLYIGNANASLNTVVVGL